MGEGSLITYPFPNKSSYLGVRDIRMGINKVKSVQLISYQYPNTLRISIKGKLYTYLTSEHWARKVMRQMEYGEGWRKGNRVEWVD